MPRVAEFYGISIHLYYQDHAPPHFHAIYGGHEAEVEISSGAILKGYLPARARRLMREWAESYRHELAQNWDRARAGLPLNPLPPLE